MTFIRASHVPMTFAPDLIRGLANNQRSRVKPGTA